MRASAIVVTTLCWCALGATGVAAQIASSTNFRLTSQTLNGAGGRATSSSFAVSDCLSPDPVAAGASSSTSFRMQAGCAAAVVQSVCGNSIVESGEQCDDGNTTPGDCCSATCQYESSGSACQDDGNTCTDDQCDGAATCTHPNNTAACSDGNPCTTNDTCNGGSCASGPPLDCNDGNLCTDDSCSPLSGCMNTNNTLPCSDGNACTVGDVCGSGVCVSGPGPNCDDGNVCTDDTCSPSTGCVNTDNTAPCDDGSACTTSDTCSGGTCTGGPAPNCDDADSCTTDTCDSVLGCQNTVTVESPSCLNCADALDNDSDSAVDANDTDCATLAVLQEFVILATRISSSLKLGMGTQLAVTNGSGSGNDTVPYPTTDSRARVCAVDEQIKAGAEISGAATTGLEIGGSLTATGDVLFKSRAVAACVHGVFVTGAASTVNWRGDAEPCVGAPAYCGSPDNCCPASGATTACTTDADCPTAQTCSVPRKLSDALNTYVDQTGGHTEYQNCETAQAAVPGLATAMGSLAVTDPLGKVRLRRGEQQTITVGSGQVVLGVDRLALGKQSKLTLSGQPDTILVLRVDGTFKVGREAVIELQGMTADHVLYYLDGRGNAKLGMNSKAAGTIFAAERRVVLGRNSELTGAVTAERIMTRNATVIHHLPFTELVQ